MTVGILIALRVSHIKFLWIQNSTVTQSTVYLIFLVMLAVCYQYCFRSVVQLSLCWMKYPIEHSIITSLQRFSSIKHIPVRRSKMSLEVIQTKTKKTSPKIKIQLGKSRLYLSFWSKFILFRENYQDSNLEESLRQK